MVKMVNFVMCIFNLRSEIHTHICFKLHTWLAFEAHLALLLVSATLKY